MHFRIVIIFIGFALFFTSSGIVLSQSEYSYTWTYDDNDIPHISATTDKNALYGQGFEMAKAQGPYLYVVYSHAIGKMTKYYGGTHDLTHKHVQNDYRVALWQFPELAQATYSAMGRTEKVLLRAFCDGINAAMVSGEVPPAWSNEYPGTREDFLPDGIEPWHVVAAYMRYSYMPVSDLHIFKDEITGEFQNRNFPNGNSNSWALPAEDGSMWLQVDPHSHLGEDTFLMTFGCSVESNEKLRWKGFNPLGLPLMGVGVKLANPTIQGSQDIAWTITAAPPDMGDLYEVDWDDVNWKYLLDGRMRQALTKEILIEFPDPEDNWLIEVPYSPDHGPWIKNDEIEQKAYFGRAFWQVWSGSNNFMRQWYGMLKANNLDEFQAALTNMAFHGGNLMVATNSPNSNKRAYYMLLNPVPDRTTVPNYETIPWTEPVDGTDSANIWYQVHDFSWLPHADGSVQDHFINCNCSIDITCPSLNQDWPIYLTGGLGI